MMTPSELRPGDLIEWRYCDACVCGACDAWRAVKLGEVMYSPVCGCYIPLDGLHLLIAHVDQVLTFMSPTTGGTKLHQTLKDHMWTSVLLGTPVRRISAHAR